MIKERKPIMSREKMKNDFDWPLLNEQDEKNLKFNLERMFENYPKLKTEGWDTPGQLQEVAFCKLYLERVIERHGFIDHEHAAFGGGADCYELKHRAEEAAGSYCGMDSMIRAAALLDIPLHEWDGTLKYARIPFSYVAATEPWRQNHWEAMTGERKDFWEWVCLRTRRTKTDPDIPIDESWCGSIAGQQTARERFIHDIQEAKRRGLDPGRPEEENCSDGHLQTYHQMRAEWQVHKERLGK